MSKGAIESAERQAAIIFAEAEAKRYQEAHEYEERKAKETAANYAAEAAALRKRTEEEEAEERAATANQAPACVVPSLKGDTLRTARRVLSRAHCRLGDVSRPAHRDKELLITRQSSKPGDRLPARAAIEATLGNRYKDKIASRIT